MSYDGTSQPIFAGWLVHCSENRLRRPSNLPERLLYSLASRPIDEARAAIEAAERKARGSPEALEGQDKEG
ncbi:MAG TPA: hypothetical protein VGA02_10130 [Gemmatimonadales bacterium]